MNNNLKEIKAEAINTIRVYLKSKRTVDLLNHGYLSLAELKKKISFEIYKNIAKVEATLSCMDKNYYFIIQNDFISPKEPFWWQDYYSRSTYYRVKNKALEQFLNLYKQDS